MAADPEKAEGAVQHIEVDNEDEEEEESGGLLVPNLSEPQHGLIQMGDLAPEVLKRVQALKKNQLEVVKIESEFYKEMHALEVKFFPRYKPFFEKRKDVVSGRYEPTPEECEYTESAEMAEAIKKLALTDKPENVEKVPGIPGFWVQIFNNVEMLADLTEEYDLPILKHLDDIEVEMINDPVGFRLKFHFSKNEFFTNEVLIKTYAMKFELDEAEPFSFEGPEIVRCEGCTIDWAKGKNVTVKNIKKKQKHKQRGSIRTITKQISQPSFFNFFSPPQINELSDEAVDDDLQLRLTSDFEIGQYIRERIVPRAVLYYTGEALEDSEFDSEEEEEEEDGETGDEEEDEDENRRGSKSNKNRDKGLAGKQNPADCKQQ